MTVEQKAAYIHAQSAAALIQAMGMMAANLYRYQLGEAPEFSHDAFEAMINNYGIHHNAVLDFFRD